MQMQLQQLFPITFVLNLTSCFFYWQYLDCGISYLVLRWSPSNSFTKARKFINLCQCIFACHHFCIGCNMIFFFFFQNQHRFLWHFIWTGGESRQMHVSAPWLQLPQFTRLLPIVTWKNSLGKKVASKYVVYKLITLLFLIFKLHLSVLCSQL